MDLLIIAVWGFSRVCLTIVVLIGWWKLGYRDGGSSGFASNPRTRGFVSVVCGMLVLLLFAVLSSPETRESPGSSQRANNVELGELVLFFFPWIYLTVIGFCKELWKKFQKD
jgi:hypothetical protein